jgi:hypothetical protein
LLQGFTYLQMLAGPTTPYHRCQDIQPKCERKKNMRLQLISGAVLLYTLLTLAAICLAELGTTPQNVPF